eukprot:1011107_1
MELNAVNSMCSRPLACCIVSVIISIAPLIAVLYNSGSIIDYVTIYDERFVSTEYGIDELSLTNQSNPNWYRYRLGDMVRWKNKAKNEEWGYQYHKHQFPQSIATQYLSYKFEDLNGTLYLNRDAKFKDYRLLLQIVRNRTINS